MISIASNKISITRNLILIVLTFQILPCTGQVKEKTVNDKIENGLNNQSSNLKQATTFPQIHTNLNGMVSEFVRCMYQDTKGNYWFGTNGNGIIRYDGKTLERVTIEQSPMWLAIRKIIEDKVGNIWFGTSSGLVKYDGTKFTLYTTKDGLTTNVVQSIFEDNKGQLWFGTWQGLCIFDGEKFVNARDKEPWTN